ncbi:MAG: hypothetical protein Q4F06_06420 [Eubacteriales bacterium]|nr:hypothetical protein [Eubacteriales bacterium]
MKKLAELWVTKKGLCVGIIAGVAVLTAGGITTAVVVSGQSGRKTEVQVASDETIEYTSKDNQTTKATEIKETTQKASEATTEESKEDGSSETQGEVKSNDGEIAVDSVTLGNPTESDNRSSNNTQGSNNQNVPDSSNQTEADNSGGSNSTENKNTESNSETQTSAVVHGANGVILDTLTMYKKSGYIPVPKTTDEIPNSDTFAYGSTINSSETASVFRDGINFGTSTKTDVISRYGEPYKTIVQSEATCLLYRYGNYTSDDNKVVYMVYCFGIDNILYRINAGGYKAMFD